MTLTDSLRKQYTQECFTAAQAQELAHLISWGPVVFQVARLMNKYGILELIAGSEKGVTMKEISGKTGLSLYAAKCLLEAALTTHMILVDDKADTFSLGKIGWFLLNDPLVRTDIDFNHDVNYIGWFKLDEALETGKPAGLSHFGQWATIYEALSQLPEQVQKSWFGFDHYYSDHSFDEALQIIFSMPVKHLLDVGGNTGKFARKVVEYNPKVHVTVCDLPQQLQMMQQQNETHPDKERIHGYAMNLLDEAASFPTQTNFDVIWMSQFLDCFAEKEINSILTRASKIMNPDNRLVIMETLWDRQKYAPAAMSLTMTSLYFTALANGNSKMYNTDDMTRLINNAGLQIEHIHDNIGMGGHSILICKKLY